jgi:uncharacterized protein (TIGR02271 family)
MDMQQTIQPGANVYGADGDKVGTVASSTGQYIVVEKGFFFPKDYYIPLNAVAESSGDAVYLSVTKDDALNQGWDQEPTGTYTGDMQQGTVDTQYAGSADQNYAEQDALRVPVHEEHLAASKRQAQAGEVTINKQVVEEQETVAVPLTEERVRVEWRAPSGEVSTDGDVFEEGVIEIPVTREEMEVTKQTVQTGELEVTKERNQRTQQVTDSVRREVVDVDDTTVEGQRRQR